MANKANWLALLLTPGRPISAWDEGWETLTGLGAEEVLGLQEQVLLDWLFPSQPERNLVEEWLDQPRPTEKMSTTLVLQISSPAGRRPMLCRLHFVAHTSAMAELEPGETSFFAGPLHRLLVVENAPRGAEQPEAVHPDIVVAFPALDR